MPRKYEELRSKVRKRPGAEERITARVAELEREASLAEIRRALEMTQQQLAASLGLSQPGISRIENETDLFVSTLRSYVEALGGELEIAAIFEDLRIPISTFTSLAEEPNAA
jgi:transcriptional regulator with XRE-family HTH domain